MKEIPDLSAALPQGLLEKYHLIPLSAREKFERKLHGIKRWGEGGKPETYGNIDYLPKPLGFSESDLEHTIGILQMAANLQKFYPLGSEVNWDNVMMMAIVHDAGEIRIGDAPSCGPIRGSKRWNVRKGYESVVVYDLISQIANDSLANWVTNLYDRYIQPDTKDKEALIANFLDKAQGTLVKGPVIFNNYGKFGHDKPSDELMAHVTTSLAVVHEKTEAVLASPLSFRAS